MQYITYFIVQVDWDLAIEIQFAPLIFQHFLSFCHYNVIHDCLVVSLPQSWSPSFLQRTLISFDGGQYL